MITVAVEQLHDVLEELKPLFVPHYEELALNQDKAELDPQYEVYLEREALGQVLCVIVRDRGQVIAYFVGFVAPALHYRSVLTLTMDIFWLHPSFRAPDSLTSLEADMTAEKLFEAVKAEAVRRGVQRVYFGSKVHRNSGEIFKAMGLVEVDRYYSAWWGS